MKKILSLLLAAAITVTVTAQKETEENKKSITPPAAVKAAFEKTYKDASKIKWSKEGTADYEASFVYKKIEMSAVYDAVGNLKETEWEMKASDLPVAITDYVKKNYKGKKIEEAAKIVKANGEINYEAEVDGKDVIFDANGKFIKEKKD